MKVRSHRKGKMKVAAYTRNAIRANDFGVPIGKMKKGKAGRVWVRPYRRGTFSVPGYWR